MVSAIITSFKRENSIVERAILSIQSQTIKDIEIILVDDNANDSQYAKDLRSLSEKHNIRYIKVDGNRGACYARNIGMENAKGEYVAFLDDDDTWNEDKIEKQLNVFRVSEKENLGLVYCSGTIFYDDTKKIEDYFNFETFKKEVTFDDLLRMDYIGSTSQPLIKKQCFKDCGGFNINQPAKQDYEMWLRIANKYKIAGIPDKLFVHHMHSNEQISKNKNKSFIGYENIYKEFIEEYSLSRSAENAILNRIVASETGKNRKKVFCYRVVKFLKYHFKKYKQL